MEITTDVLSRFSGGQLIGLVAVIGGLVYATISVIATSWVRVRKSRTEAELKTDMLDRGMSADEIKIVLESGRS